jgi:hypothetical protein
MEQTIHHECTFQPKINQKSKKMMEPNEYDQLYQEYLQDFQVVGYDQLAAGEGVGAGVGVGGQTTPLSISSSRTKNIFRNQRINFQEPEKMLVEIQQHMLAKEAKRREKLIAKEIEEIQNCTFIPNLQYTRQYRPETEEDDPILVRGLGRYLELKDMAQRIKQEQNLREQQAFHVVHVDKYRRAEDGSTIIKVSLIIMYMLFL